MRLLPLLLPLAVTLPAQDPVLCGIDVLVRDRFAPLRGARVGLITNHTGLDREGRSTVDLLLAAEDVDVVALFSPEHGFHGVLDAKVADSVHAGSGLPIHSLYGETRKPTAEMLDGVDTLVFDIQDIGCRFYTYVSTMGLAMEAAAEHGLRFVVLDRPNPIGGVAVAGPVLDEGEESFVGWHTVPVRHGMTVGELARLFRAERVPDVALEVVAVEGWERAEHHDRTDLYWTDPSPNMRAYEQALLYPGVGLLETTNVSVGRGTDTPFEVLGAPWMDGRALARRIGERGVPGVSLIPIRFTPTSSKFADEACDGVHFVVTDRGRFDPLHLGIELACALRDLFAEHWDPERYPRLLGDRGTFEALLSGASADLIHASWQAELRAFAPRRQRALLYGEER